MKNISGTRDPEIKQSKKGDPWHFGMKAHVAVDAVHKRIRLERDEEDRDREGMFPGDGGEGQPSRTVPRAAIHVEPDGQVLVDATQATPVADVIGAVKKRSRWISQHVAAARARLAHVLPREYVSGELDAWYRQHARALFADRLAAVAAPLHWVRQLPPTRLQHMTVQWGSCSPAGRITLNPLLVKAPRECIDYVVLHELCHLLLHNHSPKFYRALDRYMPNWRAVKQKLDNMAEELFRA